MVNNKPGQPDVFPDATLDPVPPGVSAFLFHFRHFAPFFLLVFLDTTRKLERRLDPPLDNGFLWSTSRRSPTLNPMVRLALFLAARAFFWAGFP
jgi:hypothetical protein